MTQEDQCENCGAQTQRSLMTLMYWQSVEEIELYCSDCAIPENPNDTGTIQRFVRSA